MVHNTEGKFSEFLMIKVELRVFIAQQVHYYSIILNYTNFDWSIYTAWCSCASAVLGVIILSVCLSVRRVRPSHVCFVTKPNGTADILIPHKKAITLVFWHQQQLVGDAPYRLKFALSVTHPLKVAKHVSRGLSAIAELPVLFGFAQNFDYTVVLALGCHGLGLALSLALA